MKTKLVFIAVACLSFLAASAQAQIRSVQSTPRGLPELTAEEQQKLREFDQLTPEERQRFIESINVRTPEPRQLSPEEQYFAERTQEAILKGAFRSAWNGRGITGIFTVLAAEEQNDPLALLAAFGISEEQYGQIGEHINASLADMPKEMLGDPELSRYMTEMGQLQASEIPDAETMEKVLDLLEKSMEIQGSFVFNAAADAMEVVLSAEHLQQLQETLLANMEAMPFVTPSMFEALNLTDAQKEQMAKIKKELEPEFEAVLENWMNGYKTLTKMTAEDPEHKKIVAEIQSKGQGFAMRFRTQMFDVLTDEQWVRLQNLIDNPPEHALVFRKKLRELAGISGEGHDGEKSEESDVWVPGPGSWRPGDAIPIQYRQERETRSRFPRGEN